VRKRYQDSDFLHDQFVVQRKSAGEIAEMCGVARSTINMWLSRHEIERTLRYKNREWLREQYVEKRRSQAEIAELCGVSKATICHWLARLEITDGESTASTECIECGDRFWYYPSLREGRYRSNGCANIGKRDQTTLECPNCGTEFNRRKSLGVGYCSHECWADEYGVDAERPYSFGWESMRLKALERDDHECTVCGITDEEHRDRFGFGLDVHHVVPVRLFAQWDKPIEDAHTLRNLETVCRTHHPDAPGFTVQDGSTPSDD
jgi:transposase/ribosomal protein L37AE/L43A